MHKFGSLALAAGALFAAISLPAQSTDASQQPISTSTQPPAAPAGGSTLEYSTGGEVAKPTVKHVRASAGTYIAFTVSPLGLGGEIATPIFSKLSARVNFHTASISGSFTDDSIPYVAKLNETTAGFHLDLAPFGGSFRLSPGVMAYNKTHATGHAMLASGTQFDLGDSSYVSGSPNPITADANLQLGGNFSPMFTFGWSSLIHSQRFMVPLEIGAVYVGKPKVSLVVTGTACDMQNDCSEIESTPEGQVSIAQQLAQIRSDVNGIQVLPIISIGFGYRFR